MNCIVHKNVSPVSNKKNTTDESLTAYYTDIESKTQLEIIDTPGVTKTSNN